MARLQRDFTSCYELFLSVVLNACATWSLTLKEKRRLRMFKNRMLRRIFGSKRGAVRAYWRRLHNGELNDLYSSPNAIPVITYGREERWGKLKGRSHLEDLEADGRKY